MWLRPYIAWLKTTLIALILTYIASVIQGHGIRTDTSQLCIWIGGVWCSFPQGEPYLASVPVYPVTAPFILWPNLLISSPSVSLCFVCRSPSSRRCSVSRLYQSKRLRNSKLVSVLFFQTSCLVSHSNRHSFSLSTLNGSYLLLPGSIPAQCRAILLWAEEKMDFSSSRNLFNTHTHKIYIMTHWFF